MLNEKGVRELAYVVKVDDIKPIEGKDRVECAVVGGWTCMVPKGQFKPGSLGIYFEIDSKLDTSKEYFAFLEKYHGKIKTQKFKTFYSQGLLMHPHDFGWDVCGKKENHEDEWTNYIEDENCKSLYEGDFLTEYFGVTYSDPDDNKRKAASADKYKKMAQRHPELFSKPAFRWLMKRKWGKQLLFLFFGKKKDSRVWPSWVVKTDEERVQNIPWILDDKQTYWYATEKIDGTSTTFTMKGRGRKREYYICSRNVCFDTPEKMANGAWYATNVYQEMGEKYNIKEVLADMLDNNKDLEFVTLQGETYGEGIQKRDYGLKGHDFMAFNLIYGYKDGTTQRQNPLLMKFDLGGYGIPCVPIVDVQFEMPNTVEELLNIATGSSWVDDGMREGLVFRSEDGTKSFKAVSNEFLVKYHN